MSLLLLIIKHEYTHRVPTHPHKNTPPQKNYHHPLRIIYTVQHPDKACNHIIPLKPFPPYIETWAHPLKIESKTPFIHYVTYI